MDNIIEIVILLILGTIFGIELFNLFIPILKRLKYGQSIRSEGPVSHLSKTGTPTMGGVPLLIITFFIWFTLIILNFEPENKQILEFSLLLVSLIGFSIIGFIDDYLIIVKKTNDGLKPKTKFIMQLIVSATCYFLILSIRKTSIINFFGYNFDIKFFYGILLLIAYSGFSNATNLTDGLDGLLGGCYLIILTGIIVLSFVKSNTVVLYFSISLFTGLISFLIFNMPKAKVFMGDTGSLFLGSTLVTLLILLNLEILVFIFGALFLFETLSVMIQVWFFKKTKGKRLFKMTPFHHHLELIGFNNVKINIIFWLITCIFTIIGTILGVLVF